MAIVGIGIDLIEISRIERVYARFGKRFLHKILSISEYKYFLLQPSLSSLAARFAAKEAAVKALGTGFSEGVAFKHIEILSLSNGKPILYLHDIAEEKAKELHVTNILVTLTHNHTTAGAVVIFES